MGSPRMLQLAILPTRLSLPVACLLPLSYKCELLEENIWHVSITRACLTKNSLPFPPVLTGTSAKERCLPFNYTALVINDGKLGM